MGAQLLGHDAHAISDDFGLLGGSDLDRRRQACDRVKPKTVLISAPKTCRSGARRGHDWARGATDR